MNDRIWFTPNSVGNLDSEAIRRNGGIAERVIEQKCQRYDNVTRVT
jgi:hypothetical protein